ncbi:MAG: aminotransferase class V-fold PLP-dependent enzyme [Opitutales bacterium]|jgi:cysteine desulfurase
MPYFDYNATTPMHPAALEAWRETAEQAWHNPSSPYRAAARAHALLEDARERLAALLGGEAEDYVFTAGATEANNAVFAHLARKAPLARVLVSAIEHPSAREAALASFLQRAELLPAGMDGVVDLEPVKLAVQSGGVALVSLMAANNETGVLQPWAEALEWCRKAGVPFHCDATQAFGKLPPENLAACDYVTGSAHKFGGPKGVGFLKIPRGDSDFHAQLGGEQEHGHRAGTENLPGVMAMLAALEARAPLLAPGAKEWLTARVRFEKALAKAVPGAVVVGAGAERLWNTVMFLAPRHENMRWVAALDKRGFQVSTGSACATGREGPSQVLAAMGMAPAAARRAVRVSAGWETSTADWDALLEALRETGSALDAGA